MKNKLLAMFFKSPALCKRRMLSAQFKQRKNRYRILRLFGIEEPICTKKLRSQIRFQILPKKRTFSFVSGKLIMIKLPS